MFNTPVVKYRQIKDKLLCNSLDLIKSKDNYFKKIVI